MSDFVDNEAMVSDDEDMASEAGGSGAASVASGSRSPSRSRSGSARSGSDENEDDENPTQSKSGSSGSGLKKKKSAVISSDEDDEDEDEDEEKAKEEMKGFIADDDEEEDDGSDSDGVRKSSSGRNSRHKHRRRRSRSRSRSRSDEDIDEEDMELLQENLGFKFKKNRKRIKIDDASDDDEGPADSRSNDELPDIDQASRGGMDDGDGYESEDVDDFIVGDDGQPIKRDRKKKKQHLFNDSARQMAEDIFGVAFDYDEFEQYGEEDYESEDEDLDEDDEDLDRPRRKKDRKKKATKTIFDLYEPRELELRHFTKEDDDIRNNDIPERMQLRATPVTSVPPDSDELDREAEWIFKYGFAKPGVSMQTHFSRSDCENWARQPGTVEKIKKALDFMRQQFLEVPFIAFYRKEYVQPELKINDLWRVYNMDELWCKLQTRKRNLRNLMIKMQAFQGDTIMADPEAPLSDDVKLISNEDIEKVEQVETFEEYKDRDQHFKLYYGRDIEIMQEAMKRRKKEDKLNKKHRKKEKKRKTKTITNEDGEDVEVTDDEAISEPEEEEPEIVEPDDNMDEDVEALKQAKRHDAFSLCKKYKITGIAQKFGLTAEQFGHNLHDGYQRFDVEQEANEPLEVAAEFKNDKISNPQDILEAAKHLVATQIARDPLVRKVTRDAFFERATITARPTKKGIKDIDEDHECYAMKYLKDKPVRDLKDDQWIRLTQAEEQKIMTIELGQDLCSVMGNKTFLEEAKELFKYDAYSKSVQEWNNLRGQCVEIAFKRMLFPMLRKELRLKLNKEAKDGIIHACRNKLYDWIKVGRYSVTFEDEDEDDWDSTHGCRVMAVMYNDDPDVASYAVSLSTEGEVVDILKLDHLLKRKNSWKEKESQEKISDLKALKGFIHSKRPHCIVVGAVDRNAVGIKMDLEDVIKDLVDGEAQFPNVGVFLMDDHLAKVFANSQRAEQDFRDYPEVLREAVSMARRMQDPLTEFAQLTGPENEILCLRYHKYQDLLSEDELLEALNVEFINRTNEVGVDINECVAHTYMGNLVQFVGGLGPRKAAALLKTLRQLQSSQRLENRQQLVTLCHMGPKVLINCAGFIKIDTSSLGDSEVYVEVLDGSRIHNEAYEWARKMAVDALEYDEEDGNPANALEEILQEPEKLAELDLEAFAQELERQGFGKKSITLQDIRAELTHMYKDLRDAYTPPNSEEIFNMITKETPQTFFIGKLLQAQVFSFAYKKPQGEELDQAAPVKGDQNLWRCPFCGQDDFPELTEVWNHLDADNCPGKAVGVKVRLDNGLTGFIPMKNLSDSNVLNPEERVRKGQNIFCRITKIQPERFSVECVCKSSALLDKENEWKPRLDDYYDKRAEGADSEEETKKKEQKQRQTYIKRVIVHPSFYNISFKDAEKLMVNMDQGDVIIRPSSKGEDHLTVTWKVGDDIYQHIDVREEGKDNAFSLGRSLWIGNEEFEDLDEIIARHVNPMAAHARDILTFKYYKDTDGGKREKAEEILKVDKRAAPTKIHYFLSASKEFPGKFMLSYLPRTKARHEYVTVTPDGFRFRHQNFDSLSSLMKWFKEHFRDPIPGTPGRSTSRTPYNMAGTPGGGITPGAMSLAAGTPFNPTPGFGNNASTPYTPSGQTPFMTPHQTPGAFVTPRHTPRSGIPVGGPPHRSSGNTPQGGTPRSGRQPPMPRQGMPPPHGGGYTPGRGPPHGTPSGTPGGRRPAPYPSPSGGYGSGGYSRGQSPATGHPPRGGRDQDAWATAGDAWAKGGRRTPANTTPRGYTGSTTPRFDEASNRTPRYEDSTQNQRTPRQGGSGTRTPRGGVDSTPLYDE
ncbi:hypothetical protein TCAL_10880 [Tigriopus californicus]|uniref:Suppressor of Ty 6 homolog n=1 Tax=Tigriopus californicus TaxID=6832 RepID=A0A553NC06_TIGCA|nr:transcription elongation factor SPT6-like [Tigriopus californicus]TRY62957.1 hypothetical protein TCAL_10880 [Tigriopus californicus]|eukprot:TCALIF_10880-PA protein Name:"Similar to Spt6 Transcription elongation factor SPT6 (Drosophila melanogaster)" AED:0.01 eAED:0.01 QI:294/1/1/1/0.5/0.33/3/98/1820